MYRPYPLKLPYLGFWWFLLRLLDELKSSTEHVELDSLPSGTIAHSSQRDVKKEMCGKHMDLSSIS